MAFLFSLLFLMFNLNSIYNIIFSDELKCDQ